MGKGEWVDDKCTFDYLTGNRIQCINIFIFGLMPFMFWLTECASAICFRIRNFEKNLNPWERHCQFISLILGYSHNLFPNIMAWGQWLLLSWEIKWSSWPRCLYSKQGRPVSKCSQKLLASKFSCRCGFFQMLSIHWMRYFVLLKVQLCH